MAIGTTFGRPAHMASTRDVDERWGPLAHLVGLWAGDRGRDVSYSYSEQKDVESLYREEARFDPFGPVRNGSQQLFGLDYRMKAWRLGAEDFFHMEVGYWLWEPATGNLHRCFVVPRSTTIVAEGKATADATGFRLSAREGSPTAGILSNAYLYAGAARSISFDVEVNLADGRYAYEQNLVMRMAAHGGREMHHTDRNVLARVD